MESTRIHQGDYAVLGRELHRRLRTLISLEVMDHLPVAWTFTYSSWDATKARAQGYDYEAMVRSCITWDDKATEYANRVSAYLQEEWARRRRASADQWDPMTGMADMVWALEDTLNQTAQELWPSKPRGYKVPLEQANKVWLRWQAVLRRQAWATLLRVRDTYIQRNLSPGPRCRVVRIHRTGRGMRMTGGVLWDSLDGMECILATWLRYARWHSHERGIRKLLADRTKAWEAGMTKAVEHARWQNDTRRMWALMRQLGGTGRRERKRCTKDVNREDPTPAEWEEAMAKSGKDGGCLATPIARVAEGARHDRREVIPVPRPASPGPPPGGGGLHG